MNYLEKIIIHGYKKFDNFQVNFSPETNILIGENTVGKSTILEAIEIVLNQRYFKYGADNLQQQLNVQNVNNFFLSKDYLVENLPQIKIEAYLHLDNDLSSAYFSGEMYSEWDKERKLKTGITFTYSLDETLISEFNKIDFQAVGKIIPLEYYSAKWTTFAGNPYKWQRNPIKSILVDSSSYMQDVYGSYTKRLYDIHVPDDIRREQSFDFKQNMKGLIESHAGQLSLGSQKFSFNEQSLEFKNMLDIKSGDISIRNMGSGQESLIKTELALKDNADLILIEEPENHLSYSNTRKQIRFIQQRNEMNSQLIVTTHESMILNRLNLNNAIWIQKNDALRISDLPVDDLEYFEHDDDFDILKFILANKVVLVEGASEFIMLGSMATKILDNSQLDDYGVSVISLGGIHYKHFLALAKKLQKRVLILTDNDNDENKLQEINELNDGFKADKDQIKICTPQDISIFTLEVSLYRENEELIKKFPPKKAYGTKFKKHEDLPVPLAYALNNKTDLAMYITKNIQQVNIPKYIEEGLKWLVK